MVTTSERAALSSPNCSCASITSTKKRMQSHSFLHGNIEQAIQDVRVGEGGPSNNLSHNEDWVVPNTNGTCTPRRNDGTEIVYPSYESRSYELPCLVINLWHGKKKEPKGDFNMIEVHFVKKSIKLPKMKWS